MQPEQNGPLSPDQQRLVQSATSSLIREFDGLLSPDTVAECVDDSLSLLVATATVTSYLPLLAERFARERLRALTRIGDRASAPAPRVLFVCSHNAGRSQIAAGWLRSIAGDMVVASSAGAVPTSAIPAKVIDAMAEVDVDISEEFPKPLTDEIVRAADVVVTLGCGDVCAVLPGQRYDDWQLDDPSGRDLAGVRLIRDDIRTRVEALAASLGTVV